MSESPAPQTTLLDFTTTPLAKYYGHPNHYALIIDNCFTRAECAQLTALAESHLDGWQEATIKKGAGRDEVEKDVRDCSRVLHDDPETAEMLYQRVRPFLEPVWEIGSSKPETGVVSGTWKRKNWRIKRLNERLRFLKYGPGQYFQAHCDAAYARTQEERSFLTMHLYLNGDESDACKGGATRFWGQNMKDFVDVEAKVGRVLVFQHRNLLHSGELVAEGVKRTLRSDIIYEAIDAEEVLKEVM